MGNNTAPLSDQIFALQDLFTPLLSHFFLLRPFHTIMPESGIEEPTNNFDNENKGISSPKKLESVYPNPYQPSLLPLYCNYTPFSENIEPSVEAILAQLSQFIVIMH